MKSGSDIPARSTGPPRPARRRGCWLLGAGLLAVLVFISALPKAPQHEAVRALVLRTLRERTHREVSLGSVTESLWLGVAVHDLRIAGAGGFARDGAVIALPRVELHWNALAIWRRPGDPLRALRRIVVDSPDVVVRRTADGDLELVKLFEPRQREPKQPFTFAGTIEVRQGRLRWRDESSPPVWPRADLDRLQAKARFDGRGQAQLSLSARLPGLAEQVGIDSGWLRLEPLRFDGTVRLARVDLRAVTRPVERQLRELARIDRGWLEELRGRVMVDVAKGQVEPKVDFGVDLRARVLGLAGRVAAIGVPVSDLSGGFGVRLAARRAGQPALDQLSFDGLTAAVGRSRLRLDGRVSGLRGQPTFHLRAQSRALALGELAAIVPQVPELAGLHSAGLTSASVRLDGPLSQLRAAGWVAPNEVAWERLVVLHSGRLDLDLRRVPVAAGVWGVIGRVDLDRLAAQAKWLPEGLTQVSGRLRLGDRALTCDGLRAHLGEAALGVDGRIAGLGSNGSEAFDLAVQTNGLSPLTLAPFVPRAWRPSAARGGLTGRLHLRGPLRQLELAGRLRVPWLRTPVGDHLGGGYDFAWRLGPQPQGYVHLTEAGVSSAQLGGTLDRVNGRVALQGRTVTIGNLRGRYGGGTFQAGGRVATDLRRFDLAAAVSAVDLAAAAPLLRRAGLRARGALSADLRARGRRERFSVAGWLAAPYVAGYGAALYGAQVAGGAEIQPRLGVMGVSGQVRVRRAAGQLAELALPLAIDDADLSARGGRVLLSRLRGQVNHDPLWAAGEAQLTDGREPLRHLDLRLSTSRLRAETVRKLSAKLEPLREWEATQPLAGVTRLRGDLDHLRVTGRFDASEVLFKGGPPLVLGGQAEVDLLCGRDQFAQGTVRLSQGRVATPKAGLPARQVAGALRFSRDRRMHFGEPGAPLTGRLGTSDVTVSGSIGFHEPPDFDVTVGAPGADLGDLRLALSGLPDMPELTGEGRLGPSFLRFSGTPLRYQIATVGPQGEAGGQIVLPAAITFDGQPLRGGRIAARVLMVDHQAEDGAVDLFGVGLTVPQTGAQTVVEQGQLRVAKGHLARADLQAMVAGRPVRVTGRSDPQRDGALALRVRANDVPLSELLPRWPEVAKELDRQVVSSDLSINGPADDLAVTGRVALGGADGAEPLAVDLHLRVVAPLDDPAGGAAGPREVLGGVVLAGGDLKLRSLETPLRHLRGALSLSNTEVVCQGVTGELEGAGVTLSGGLYNLPEAVWDVSLKLPGSDLGRILTAWRMPPAKDPKGAPVDFFTAQSLPRLQTPEPVTGELWIRGPQRQVTVGVDLAVPLVTVEPMRAMPDDWGIGHNDPDPERRGHVLLRQARLQGTAVGSLVQPAAAGPSRQDVATAVGTLLGVQLVADEPALAPTPAAVPKPAEPALWERFAVNLTLASEQIHPRQGLALLSPQVQAGVLRTAYAHQPARGRLELTGRPKNLRVRGELDFPRLELRGVPIRRLRGEFDYFDHVMTLNQVDLELRGGAVRGRGAMRLVASKPLDMQMDLNLSQVDLAALNALDLVQQRGVELGGAADGEVRFHLSEEVPRVTGLVRVKELSLDREQLGDGTVDFSVRKQVLLLRRCELAAANGDSHLKAKGRVGLDGEGALDLVADIRNLDLGRLMPLVSQADARPATGRLDFAGAVAGTKRAPLLTGSANVFNGSVWGQPFERLSLRSVQTGANRLDVTAELNDSAYRLALNGSLANIDFRTGELDYQAELVLNEADLARTVPLVARSRSVGTTTGRAVGSGQVSGRVRRRPAADGTEPLNPLVDVAGTVQVNAGDPTRPGRLQIAGVTIDTLSAKLTARDGHVLIESMEAASGATRIAVDPTQTNRVTQLRDNPQLELHLRSEKLRYEDLVSLTKVPLRTKGHVSFAADVTGAVRDPVASVRLATHDLEVNGERIGDRQVVARFARQLLVLDGEHRGELFGCRVGVSGSLDSEQVKAQADLEVVDIGRLRRFVTALSEPPTDEAQRPWQVSLRSWLDQIPQPLAGRVMARLDVHGRRDDPEGSFEASLRGLNSTGRPLPEVEVRLALGSGEPRQAPQPDAGVVYVVGTVPLSRTDDGREMAVRCLARSVDLAPYGKWSEKLAGIYGRLRLEASASGSLSSPRVAIDRLMVRQAGWRKVGVQAVDITGSSWEPGWVDVGLVKVVDGSLEADLSGGFPVDTRRLAIAEDRALALDLRMNMPNAAEFAQIVPALGQVEGRAEVTLKGRGTAQDLALNGLVAVDLPRLQVVAPPAGREPFHIPQPGGLAGEVSAAIRQAATVAVQPPIGIVRQNLVNSGVRLRVEDNTVRVEQCRFVSAPGGEGELSRQGSIEVLPGGQVRLPQPLSLRDVVKGRGLLATPIALKLRAQDYAGSSRYGSYEQVNLAVDVEPVFDGKLLNRVLVRRADGWFGGGWVRLAGTVGQRQGDLGRWADHLYDLSLVTPLVARGSLKPPSGVTPITRGNGVAYPVRVTDRRAGQTRVLADLRLETREGQTPPMTLAGTAELTDTELREGGLLLFGGGNNNGGEPVVWPSAPMLDLTLVARQNNWVRAKVPDLQIPIQATCRLIDTPQRLRLEGSAEVGEGQLSSSLVRSRIAVRGGRAQFTVRRNAESGVFEPFATFSGSGETELLSAAGGGDVNRYQVTLDVTGSARPGVDQPVDTEIRVSARSSPPLAQSDILSRLSQKEAFARALETGQVQGYLKQELANAAVQTAVAYALTPVFDELRKALGLDVLVVRYELDRPLEIQVGKYLLRRLFATLLVEVGGRQKAKQTIKLDYAVAGGVRTGVRYDTLNELRLTTEYTTRF